MSPDAGQHERVWRSVHHMGPSETSNQLDVVRTPAGKDPIPPFLRVEEQLPTDELDWQIGQLESEVRRYVGVEPKDFSKAAVRMYKLFRLKGFHEEATHLRDLFDEPATILYRVSSLLHTCLLYTSDAADDLTR